MNFIAANKILVFTAVALFISAGCTKIKDRDKAGLPQELELNRLKAESVKAPSYDNFILLGLEYQKLNRHQDAILSYMEAKKINPKAPLAWNNLCSAFNVLRKFADAVAFCETAIRLEPNFELAKNNLKIAKDSLEVERQFVLKTHGGWRDRADLKSTDLIGVGLAYFSIRELKDAIDAWKKIDVKDEMYAMAQNNLTGAYILQKKFDLADKAINEALRIDPKNSLFISNKKWLEESKAEAIR